MISDGLVGALIALGGKIIFDWLKNRNGNGHRNGKSGDQDPSFWKLEFRSAVREELELHEGKLKRIIEDALNGLDLRNRQR